jgi:site-specific recombinase XerD
MKLSRAIQEFLADARPRLAAQTLRGYESDLQRLLAMAEVDSVLKVTPDLLSAYFQWLVARGQKQSTLHRKRASLGEFCRWGVRKRLWGEDTARDLARSSSGSSASSWRTPGSG